MSETVDAFELAKSLAKLLPGKWTAVRDEHVRDGYALLRRSDGGGLSASVGGFRLEGKVTFRGQWPRFADGSGYSGGASCEITCSASRPVETLAKEITRRLLPGYGHALAEALVYVGQHDRNVANAVVAAKKVASAVKGTADANTRHGSPIVVHSRLPGINRLRVNPGYREEPEPSVSFEVSVDVETALRMLAAIRSSN